MVYGKLHQIPKRFLFDYFFLHPRTVSEQYMETDYPSGAYPEVCRYIVEDREIHFD
jgi:hypothetical protein